MAPDMTSFCFGNFLHILWILLFSFIHHQPTQAANGLEPVLVQIVFRHGDRSSVATYPNNPYPESAWPQGYGQLMKIGIEQHYALGGYFRDRYINGHPYRLLNASYKRNEVHVRSTDKDRTLMSAYSHLAGMYPPNSSQIWNPKIDWQPIPVHTVPIDTDNLLNTDVNCPEFDKIYNETLNSDRVKREEEQNKEFYEFVAEKSGFPNEGVSTIWQIHDTLKCESLHPELGFKMPTWTNDSIMDKMGALESLEFDLKYDGAEESRLRGGILVGEMVTNMQLKINKTIDPVQQKYFIYSAHDTTVAAFLSALKVFDKLFPPYTATVIVELLREDQTDLYSVRVLYKNDTNPIPYDFTIPGCANPCPFDQFVNLTKASIPVDWQEECGLKSHGDKESTRDLLIIIAVAVSGAILATVILFCLVVWSKRRLSPDMNYYTTVADS